MIDTDTLGVAQQKGDRKIAITDIAIEKVPEIRLKGIDDEANRDIRRCAQDVLRIAKEQNDSNEVMMLYNVVTHAKDSPILGNENSAEFSMKRKFLQGTYVGEVALIHNHPTEKSISYTDLGVFLKSDTLCIMAVITNSGRFRILQKNNTFDYTKSKKLIAEIKESLGIEGDILGKDQEIVANEFLGRAEEVWVFYARR